MTTRHPRTIADALSIVLVTCLITGACHGDYSDSEFLDDGPGLGESSHQVSTTQSGVTFTLTCVDPQATESDISCSMTLDNQSGAAINVDILYSEHPYGNPSSWYYGYATIDSTSGGVTACYNWTGGMYCPDNFSLAHGATARVDFTHHYDQPIGDDLWQIWGQTRFTLNGQITDILVEEDIEAALPATGLWHSTDYCERLDVWYPEMNFGSSHRGDIRVYDGTGTTDLGPLSDYHVFNGICNTYFPGNSTWPNSYYRFHGSKCQLRGRGLPRYIRVRFEDGGVPYSAMSPKRDLGAASCP